LRERSGTIDVPIPGQRGIGVRREIRHWFELKRETPAA
jgi:hypothetical protein